MAAVLHHLDRNIAKIANLLVMAEVANIGKIAAGIYDVNIAVLADNFLRLSRISARSDGHDRTGCKRRQVNRC